MSIQTIGAVGDDEVRLIEQCRRRSIELLKRNLSPAGILAATPADRSVERGYAAVFGRDAAICSLGMAVCEDETLEEAAAVGLLTLASHQAPNGQIPKFVDVDKREADFWYLGCIDSTLWWLIAMAALDERPRHRGLLDVHRRRIDLAIHWLLAQEHQRFFLLQQNEASDWADIMPRSGFVLYTNALWYLVKDIYRLSNKTQTRDNYNGLFHPFSASLHEYRRGRLLADYALKKARRRDLYLSFVNFASFGEDGDVFGNVLTLLFGLTTPKREHALLKALIAAQVHEPHPVRSVCEPIVEEHFLWRPYMSRHQQNFAWQYHNGGIWPFLGGFWILALLRAGEPALAREQLLKLAQCCALNDWQFNEWLHGRTFEPRGMPGQSWNAATFLMADHALRGGAPILRGFAG